MSKKKSLFQWSGGGRMSSDDKIKIDVAIDFVKNSLDAPGVYFGRNANKIIQGARETEFKALIYINENYNNIQKNAIKNSVIEGLIDYGDFIRNQGYVVKAVRDNSDDPLLEKIKNEIEQRGGWRRLLDDSEVDGSWDTLEWLIDEDRRRKREWLNKGGGRRTKGRKTKGKKIKGRKTKHRKPKGRKTKRRKTKGRKTSR